MRVVLPLCLVAVLAGCSVVPPGAWTYDPTNPQPRPMLDTAQAVQVNVYAQLHGVGMELSPLERRLSAYAQAR